MGLSPENQELVMKALGQSFPADLDTLLNAARSEARREVEALREALKPFANYYALNDLDERADSDVIEVPVGDLRRAATVYAAISPPPTGATNND